MTRNYFVAPDSNMLSKVYREVILWFKEKEYAVDSTETGDIYFVQAQKTGMLRTVFGTNLAFKVSIYWSNTPTTPNEFIIDTRVGKWVRNIAGAGVTALFTGAFTIFTGFAGASWALVLERDLIRHLQNTLNLKRVSYSDDTSSTSTATPSTETANNNTINQNTSSEARKKALAELSHEIEQLKQAREQDIITQQEFEQKKEQIEEQIDEKEIEFLIEEKTTQLQEAFASGVLSAEEYEAKLQSIEDSMRDKLSKKRKLKEARDNGILTEQEYQAKLSQL